MARLVIQGLSTNLELSQVDRWWTWTAAADQLLEPATWQNLSEVRNILGIIGAMYIYICKNPRKVYNIPGMFTCFFCCTSSLQVLTPWKQKPENWRKRMEVWRCCASNSGNWRWVWVEAKRSPNFYESMLVGTRSNLTKPCRLILDSHPGCFLKMVVPPISHR